MVVHQVNLAIYFWATLHYDCVACVPFFVSFVLFVCLYKFQTMIPQNQCTARKCHFLFFIILINADKKVSPFWEYMNILLPIQLLAVVGSKHARSGLFLESHLNFQTHFTPKLRFICINLKHILCCSFHFFSL